MARAEEKRGFMSAYSPIREHEHEGYTHTDEGLGNDVEEVGSASGCGCFRLCCFGWNQTNQETNNLLQQNQNGEHGESLFSENFKRLKEFSEIVAGPKWKNLIRKIGKYFNPKKSRTQDTYNPQSYALNFDDGAEEDNDFFMSFSSRFSAPLSSR